VKTKTVRNGKINISKSGALNCKLKNKELVRNCEADTVKKKGTSGSKQNKVPCKKNVYTLNIWSPIEVMHLINVTPVNSVKPQKRETLGIHTFGTFGLVN